LASDLNDETPWKKMNDGKQPFLCSYQSKPPDFFAAK